MAEVRALAFQAGRGVDDTCGAYEVAWEQGADLSTARVLRRCSRPPEVEWHGTGLCLGCLGKLQRSPDRHTYRIVRREQAGGDAMP